MTKQKKLIKYFIIFSVVLIGLLPSYNFYQNNKNYDFSKLYNIDSIEKYINYAVYKIFNRSMNQKQVITGKDGFLFLGNQYKNVLYKTNGEYRPSKKEIDLWTDELKNLQQWYEDKGIKFVIVIAPNKHTIYKEKLPYWMQYNGKTITDDIVEFSQKKNINMLDLRPILSKHNADKEILYYKTDTHWNEKGASLAYDSTIDYINGKYSINIQKTNYSLEESYRGGGDLSKFLKISSILKNDYEKKYNYIFNTQFDICKGNINRNNGNLEKCIKVNNPVISILHQPQYIINSTVKENKLLLLCDSFGTTLSQLYNSSFNTIWRWHFFHINGEKLSNFIEKNKPDIVIYQLVERDLYNNDIIKPLPKINVVDYSFVTTNKVFDLTKDNFYQNNHFNQTKKKDFIELEVINHDPIIILNDTKSKSKNVVLSYEIVSPLNTKFQLFYKENKDSNYNENDSYKVNLKKGSNHFNLLIPSRYINNGLRVDLVSSVGKYKLKRFEIYEQ